MKYTLALLLLTAAEPVALGQEQEDNPVVLTIEGDQIYAAEFWKTYTKNNPHPSTKKKDVKDYMELFLRYKLKVKEAEKKGYDTLPRLRAEYAQYRKQLEAPYLTSQERREELIREAYERTQHELNARHILVKIDGGTHPSPEDTLLAYKRIIQLRNRILNGEDFGAVAAGKGGSDDPSAKTNRGELGYFSAFQMVYPFEDKAYNTAVGQLSMPVRTRFGYHIIQVTDKRKARGQLKTAHIMVSASEKSSEEERQAAQEKIAEIYQLLQGGAPFEELVQKYSDDASSKKSGGQLPVFGAGARQRMVPAFEAAAFELKEDGAYSQPIQTPYGYHIIRRIALTPNPDFSTAYPRIKAKVERDVRSRSSRSAFLKELKAQYGFYLGQAQKSKALFYAIDLDSFKRGTWKGLDNGYMDDQVMFGFGDSVYTVGDFEEYLLKQNGTQAIYPVRKFVEHHFDQWSDELLLTYEKEQLEQKYPEFKALVREYREGILVYEIMQDEVWRKGSEDSLGLRRYYREHRKEFTYPNRYKGVLYKCGDKSIAAQVYQLVRSASPPDSIKAIVNADSPLNVGVSTGTFNPERSAVFMKGKKVRKLKQGANKPFSQDDLYYVVDVEEVLPPRDRTLEESMGWVTSIYQNQLEADFIAQLKPKYDYAIDYKALYGSVAAFSRENQQ